MHLTVFSYPSTLDWELEPAVFQVNNSLDPKARQFRRCQRPEQLVWIVKSVVDQAGARLKTLDIFGHGCPGTLILGDNDKGFVTPDESSWDSLTALDEYLEDEADVRLLGCETGADEDGLKVLKGLAQKLSGKPGQARTVWGTNATISWYDFGPEGLKADVADKCLESSRVLTDPVKATKRIATDRARAASGVSTRGG